MDNSDNSQAEETTEFVRCTVANAKADSYFDNALAIERPFSYTSRYASSISGLIFENTSRRVSVEMDRG